MLSLGLDCYNKSLKSDYLLPHFVDLRHTRTKRFMKKIKTELDDWGRPEYSRSDLGELVRGKYANTMSHKTPMTLETLKTPGLILDIDRVKRNAKRIGERLKGWSINLRPHVKTHKCIEVAKIQTEGHSGAVTVSTLAEAKAFAA